MRLEEEKYSSWNCETLTTILCHRPKHPNCAVTTKERVRAAKDKRSEKSPKSLRCRRLLNGEKTWPIYRRNENPRQDVVKMKQASCNLEGREMQGTIHMWHPQNILTFWTPSNFVTIKFTQLINTLDCFWGTFPLPAVDVVCDWSQRVRKWVSDAFSTFKGKGRGANLNDGWTLTHTHACLAPQGILPRVNDWNTPIFPGPATKYPTGHEGSYTTAEMIVWPKVVKVVWPVYARLLLSFSPFPWVETRTWRMTLASCKIAVEEREQGVSQWKSKA